MKHIKTEYTEHNDITEATYYYFYIFDDGEYYMNIVRKNENILYEFFLSQDKTDINVNSLENTKSVYIDANIQPELINNDKEYITTHGELELIKEQMIFNKLV
jgi:hypothetical protein